MVTRYDHVNALLWKNIRQRTRSSRFYSLEIVYPLAMGVTFLILHSLPSSPRDETAKQDVRIVPASLDGLPLNYNPPSEAAEKLMKSASIVSRAVNNTPVRNNKMLDRTAQPWVIFLEMRKSTVPKDLRFLILGNPSDSETNYQVDEVIWIQYQVAQTFINYWRTKTGNTSKEVHMLTMKIPLPRKFEARVEAIRKNSLRFVFCFCLMGTVGMSVYNIVLERQMRLKEFLKRIGVSDMTYFGSWFITSFLLNTVTMLYFWVILILNTGYGGIMEDTSWGLLLLLMILYAINITTFIFLLAASIPGANYARAFGYFFLVLFYLMGEVMAKMESTSKSYITGTLVFSQGLSFCLLEMNRRILAGEPSTFSNIHQALPENSMSVLDGFIHMLLNSVFNLCLAWYVSALRPGQFGTSKRWYFFLSTDYWWPEPVRDENIPRPDEISEKYFETAPKNAKTGIEINNLTKMWDNTLVLGNINLTLYVGQISVILGKERSGKTTLLSVMSGVTPPTKGTVKILGRDVTKHSATFRKTIGQCLQYNILFVELSVQDHLKFYRLLHGLYGSQNRQKHFELLSPLGLSGKSNFMAMTLSDQLKRHLSLACAFAGDPKVVYLDDPSLGLPLHTKHIIWNFLYLMKKDRVIVVTTTSMEEASQLGDRLAIMHNCVLKCCGTPTFLKNVYNVGYKLVVWIGPNCQINEITMAVKIIVPGARYLGRRHRTIYYSLPDKFLKSIPALLRDLEDNATSLNISSYGLSANSMDEIVLHAEAPMSSGEQSPAEGEMSVPSEGNLNNMNLSFNAVHPEEENEIDLAYRRNSGCQKLYQQTKAVFITKALKHVRNWPQTVFFLALVPCILLAFRVGKTGVTALPHRKVSNFWFSLETFARTTTYIEVKDGQSAILGRHYKAQFKPPHTVFKASSSDLKVNTFSKDLLQWEIANDHLLHSKRILVAAQLNPQDNGSIAAYSKFIPHSQAISTQLLLNAYVKFYLGKNFSISSGVRTLHAPISYRHKYLPVLSMSTFSFGLALFPVLFFKGPLEERLSGATHLQFISGVNYVIFWDAIFKFDWIMYSIPMALCLVIMETAEGLLFQHGLWPFEAVVIVLFGLALLPYIYVTQMMYTDASAGVIAFLFFNIFLGVIASFFMSYYRILRDTVTSSFMVFDILFSIASPNYCCTTCILSYNVAVLYQNDFDQEKDFGPQLVSRHKLVVPFVFQFLHIIFWNILLVLLDSYVFRSLWYKCGAEKDEETRTRSVDKKRSTVGNGENYEVAEERQRINWKPKEELWKTDALILKNVYKVKDGTAIVNKISVGIRDNECFGLLGPKGCGETMVIKLLSGELALSGGNIYFRTQSIRNKLRKIQASMGYCPQFDGLQPHLTGRESLFLHGRLRGVPEKQLADVTNSLARNLLFFHQAKKRIRTYSPVTKRQLSLAIALIGDPSLLILDEPTAGMDLTSKRQMWAVLKKTIHKRKTTILATHCVDEIEALCSRVAIIVTGKLVCLGDLKDLKSQFAHGYTVVVQTSIHRTEQVTQSGELEKFLVSKLPGSKVVEKRQGYVNFRVPENGLRLSDIFEIMERAKQDFELDFYRIHQTNIEDIFHSFINCEPDGPQQVSTACRQKCWDCME